MKRKKETWSGERKWVEIIENQLYPPEAITLVEGVKEMIKNESFKGKKILDHGCGTGRFGKIAQDKGANVIGIDISKKILKKAAEVIKVKQADCVKLPFKDNSFDYVFSFMVLQILNNENLEKALIEMQRILKPKGKLFFAIVHPHSEKWDSNTKKAFQDNSTYNKTESRLWVFHFKKGDIFEKFYVHKPLGYYFNLFSKYFDINKILEPSLPEKYYNEKGKYSRLEYLMGRAIVKK